MKKFIAIISMFIGANALASTAKPTINLKYGFGIIQSMDSQVVSVGYQSSLYHAIHQQYECGGWLDPKKDKGRSGSVFCSYSLGLKVVNGGFYIESLHGVGGITVPDSLLGGRFQFFHDVGVGIQDQAGFAMGVQFKHVSSAGIHKPNIGRNFVALKMGFAI